MIFMNSYYSWIIYGWKQIPSHFPSFNSSSDPQIVILSRWVSRSVTYKEYIDYDHYIIMAPNKTKNNSTEDLVPFHISSHKEKLLMMPQSHYEERFTYYDSVRNASFNTKDYRTYYFGKERENKRRIYFQTLKIHRKYLYDLEIEKEKGKYFSTRNSPLDWIVWYDYYNSIPRDPNYLYGYNVSFLKKVKVNITGSSI